MWEKKNVQDKIFFQKSIILITEHLSQNPTRSNILYWIRKCVKVFLERKGILTLL